MCFWVASLGKLDELRLEVEQEREAKAEAKTKARAAAGRRVPEPAAPGRSVTIVILGRFTVLAILLALSYWLLTRNSG